MQQFEEFGDESNGFLQHKVYYSHSMRIYDTKREQKELEIIKNHWKGHVKILNPNGEIQWEGSMEPYLKAAHKTDYVVCSEYKEHVGKGVFCEICSALAHSVPVLVIRDDKLHYVNGIVEDDRNDWAINYGKLIVKGE